MKFKIASAQLKLAVLGMVVVALSAGLPMIAGAQDRPPQRQIRELGLRGLGNEQRNRAFGTGL